jgi:uncharacterized protein YgiM (DUF1202 family)
MKKLISILAAVALLLTMTVSIASAEEKGLGLGTMFVYTENGKTLNVRSTPETGDNVIGQLAYGAQVNVIGFEGGWARITYLGGTAWVQSRFLQWYAPGPKPTPQPEPKPDPDAEQMNAELNSEVSIPRTIAQAQARRATGWVNMRIYPSKETGCVQTCPDGAELIAFAETINWYHVTDPATGNSGYIRKDFLKIVPVEQPVVDEETRIGTLNVNGEFMLQGKIPEGYKLQVISARNTRIIAALVAEDESRPQMLLTIAFDEMFANKERMNDLSAEEIETLKASFTDMNEVEFTDGETAAGTKLLIARETGSDEDFVSIISLYKGYSVEFVLSPNPKAAEQKLTDEQIQTGIDFLSNLDFIPAN